jgi:hypothetical protein
MLGSSWGFKPDLQFTPKKKKKKTDREREKRKNSARGMVIG